MPGAAELSPKGTRGADFLLGTAVDDLRRSARGGQARFHRCRRSRNPAAAPGRSTVAIRRQIGQVIRLDRLAETVSGAGIGLVGDPELLPFSDGSLDLVGSALALQWVTDLPGCLAQIQRALKPDGLFIANLLGGETLHELRESFTIAEAELTGGASPRIAPFAELREIGALLQRAGFALPVVDQDRVRVRYSDALGLMRDLRAMGATNALSNGCAQPLRRDVLMRAVQSTPNDFPTRMAVSAQRSTSSPCRDGRRMKANKSRSARAAPNPASPMRSALRSVRPAKRPVSQIRTNKLSSVSSTPDEKPSRLRPASSLLWSPWQSGSMPSGALLAAISANVTRPIRMAATPRMAMAIGTKAAIRARGAPLDSSAEGRRMSWERVDAITITENAHRSVERRSTRSIFGEDHKRSINGAISGTSAGGIAILRNSRGRIHLSGLRLDRPRRSLPFAAHIEKHQQMELFIGVTGEGQGRQTGRLGIDADLFPQFPDQRLFRRFSGFDLSAGKFPKAGHRLPVRTLGDQHPTIDIDKRAGRHQKQRHER